MPANTDREYLRNEHTGAHIHPEPDEDPPPALSALIGKVENDPVELVAVLMAAGFEGHPEDDVALALKVGQAWIALAAASDAGDLLEAAARLRNVRREVTETDESYAEHIAEIHEAHDSPSPWINVECPLCHADRCLACGESDPEHVAGCSLDPGLAPGGPSSTVSEICDRHRAEWQLDPIDWGPIRQRWISQNRARADTLAGPIGRWIRVIDSVPGSKFEPEETPRIEVSGFDDTRLEFTLVIDGYVGAYTIETIIRSAVAWAKSEPGAPF